MKNPNGRSIEDIESMKDELTDREKPPKEISDRYVLLAMKQYGGSFVMRLGDAGLYADTENLQIIKSAFPMIWEFYTKAAKQDLIEQAANKLHQANFGDTRSWPLDHLPPGPIIKPPCDHPDHRSCNVCGCTLVGDSEIASGMCTAHANEGFLKL